MRVECLGVKNEMSVTKKYLYFGWFSIIWDTFHKSFIGVRRGSTLLSSRRNIRFIYDYRVCTEVYLTFIVIVYRYPSVIFFISDQFKILAGDQLHYKSSGKKIFRGGNHYNTPHYPLIHTPYRHIAIFAVLGCFWHVWRPIAQKK